LLSGYFHFGISEIFVSSLFLVLVSPIKLYCVSTTYKETAEFEEEDNDIKFTGNYAIRGWLQQPPPYRAYLVVSEDRH